MERGLEGLPKVWVACERSGVVAGAFIKAGIPALSIDIEPALSTHPYPEAHRECDIKDFVREEGYYPDLLIAHPPCTYLSGSGMHWTTRGLRSASHTTEAIHFVKYLMMLPIEHIAIENPVGVLSTAIGKPNQIIQPYDYGHDMSKRTCLWLIDLPVLVPTKYVPPTMTPDPKTGKMRKRWGNQSPSGADKTSPGPDRALLRSITPQGIADAMAAQWGPLIHKV